MRVDDISHPLSPLSVSSPSIVPKEYRAAGGTHKPVGVRRVERPPAAPRCARKPRRSESAGRRPALPACKAMAVDVPAGIVHLHQREVA